MKAQTETGALGEQIVRQVGQVKQGLFPTRRPKQFPTAITE